MSPAPPSPTLCTERLVLRPWFPADREPFATLNADPRVMEFMPGLLPREESDALADRIEAHFARWGYGLWAAEVPGVARFVGFVGLQWATFEAPFTPALEVGFRLAAPFWNRGYATEGGKAAVAFALREAGVSEVVSFTAALNLRSQHVIGKVGLVRDPAGDFHHPRLPAGHPLGPHVLFRTRVAAGAGPACHEGGAESTDPSGSGS